MLGVIRIMDPKEGENDLPDSTRQRK